MLPITAIIPTFNRPTLCAKALASIYQQSQPPAQVIVVDDGSTEELSEVRDILTLNNGLYLCQKNKGVSAARNLGVEHATQDWVSFLDSDDLWLPTKLEKQFALHQAHAALLISHTAELWINKGIRINQRKHHSPAEGFCFERCLEICCISASAVLINKDLFLSAGGFDVNLPVCEDYDLWIRLALNHEVGLISEPLVVKNRGDGVQLSSSFERLDYYRVQAIMKLLDTKTTSAQQAILAKHALAKKLSVLENGAHKRGLIEQLAQYKAIRAKYESSCAR
jgi:glycosyltransferase involved in cell wall biosynthesis